MTATEKSQDDCTKDSQAGRESRGRRGWFAILVALAFAAVSLPGTAVAQDGGTKTLKVDQAHSNVLARANHLGAGFVFVEFNEFSGTIEFNEKEPSKSSVNLAIKTASVDSGVQDRDDTLKGPDFFHAKKYPEITFESTKVKKKDDETYEVTGDLTIRDVTKSITIDVKHLGVGTDHEGKKHYGFYTEFEINRLDFGVDWKPDAGIAGKNVRIILALEGVEK